MARKVRPFQCRRVRATPSAPRTKRRPEAPLLVVGRSRLGAAELGRKIEQGRIRICKIEGNGRLVLHSAQMEAARPHSRRWRLDANATIRIARSRVSARRSEAQVATWRTRTSRVAVRRPYRLRGRPVGRTASRSGERRAGEANGPSSPFQRCRGAQLDIRRRSVEGVVAVGARALRSAGIRRRREHPVPGGALPLGVVPKVVRDELEGQPFVR